MSVELRPAASLSLAERTELFNRAYEGYVIPMHVDESMVAFMDDAFDIDLSASRVALRDGELVGLGNLGVRGEDAWIGGVGVVLPARRQGLGDLLMTALHEEARVRGIRRVWLEVIVENHGAIALYEKLGYRIVRDLEVWSLAAELVAQSHKLPAAELVSLELASTLLPAEREPWQRADASIDGQKDVQALAHDAGAAIFRLVSGNVSLLQIGGGRVDDLVRALRAYGPVSALNLPADGAAAQAFAELGGRLVVRQHEMLLEL